VLEEPEFAPPPFDFPTEALPDHVWVVHASPYDLLYSLPASEYALVSPVWLANFFTLWAWEFKWTGAGGPGHLLFISGAKWTPDEDVLLSATNPPYAPTVPRNLGIAHSDASGDFNLTVWLAAPASGVPPNDEEYERASHVRAVQGDVKRETANALKLWN
jgi:hypothetical protein